MAATISAFSLFPIQSAITQNRSRAPSNNYIVTDEGDYTITVKDTNDCLAYPSAVITQPDSIGYDSIKIDHVSCTGLLDGAITEYGAGGTTPYTYTLNEIPVSNGTGIFPGLPPGKYTVTVEDANVCKPYTTDTLEVIDPLPLVVDSVAYTEISCGGADDGSIEIFSSGGYTPHTWSINDGADFDTVSLFVGLGPGTYYTAVLDSNGICTVWGDTLIITEPLAINLDAQSSTNVSTCFGDSTGTITLAASGGTGSLEYSLDSLVWQSTGDFDSLPAGTYTPLVRDSNQCAVSFIPELIDEPQPISASVTTTTSNGNKGSIIISGASGGTGTLTYSDSGMAGPFVSDTVFYEWPGFYDVVVKDINSCTFDTTV